MAYRIDLERDELAKRFGGGLPEGALCLVEARSGAGKSVLAQRLTYGLLDNDRTVVYVSTEYTTPAFLDQMDQLGYNVMDAFIGGDLLFVSTHPLVGHVAPSQELLPRLLRARDLMTQPIVVVDAFSTLVEPHVDPDGDGEKVIEHLVRTLKQVAASGTTLILTLDPDHFEGMDISGLTGAADVRLECIVERHGSQVDRYVVVRKFARASGSVGDVIAFRVEPGAGFIVEIKAVA